ncbi:hypothetical protein DLH77_24085 [Vibrio parahaemolyticus]|nr:hypothetical protein [Vibrio parahaemolyticus]EGR3159761.1 hypothetical protein [Vibrio parahaemolyticus]
MAVSLRSSIAKRRSHLNAALCNYQDFKFWCYFFLVYQSFTNNFRFKENCQNLSLNLLDCTLI